MEDIGSSAPGLGVVAVDYRCVSSLFDLYGRGTFPPEKGYDAGIEMVMPEQLSEIVGILHNRGYSDDNLRMILGENLLRVAQVVW